jgi:ADP-heptose:LPS heptosyltransferase
MAGVVARMSPWVDELVAFPGAPGIPERPPDGTFGRWAAAMAGRGWDLALQVYGDNPAAGAVTAATGARLVGGFAATGTTGLDPALHVPYPHALHEVDRHLRLLEHLGLPPGASRALEWPVTADEEGEAAALGLARGTYAVLHPGATSPSRLWPAGRFAEVADGLVRAGLQVVVGGVPSEAATTGAVVAASRGPVRDVTGRTSLGAYAALLRDAAVVVANDTGTAHLSAAVGGRVVTVFLSGDPRRWRHAPHLQTVVREDVGCSPCPHLVCPIDHRCALRISSARVLREALLLAGRPPTPAAPSAAPSGGPERR